MSKLPHVSQITMSDRTLALILNCVEFAIVSLGKHPDAKDEKQVETLLLAVEAMESFEDEHWYDAIDRLQSAASEITDDGLSATNMNGEPVP